MAMKVLCLPVTEARAIIAAIACMLVAAGCHKCTEPKIDNPKEPAVDALAASGLRLGTASAAEDRVQRVFPKGPATEDARREIGTTPAPNEERAPESTSEWVAEINASPPFTLGAVRAAIPPAPKGRAPTVLGRTVNGAWEFVSDGPATGPYDQIAVTVMLTDIDGPASSEDLDVGIAWARKLTANLGKAPTEPISKAQALARSAAVYQLRSKLDADSLEFGIVVAAAPGKPFAGRLMWDAVYSPVSRGATVTTFIGFHRPVRMSARASAWARRRNRATSSPNGSLARMVGMSRTLRCRSISPEPTSPKPYSMSWRVPPPTLRIGWAVRCKIDPASRLMPEPNARA